MTQTLIVLGAAIFLLLGSLHGWLTLKDLGTPRAFTPPDSALREAMQNSSIRLHPSINLWKAWMGFNFSHSLGLVMFGGAFLYVGMFAPAAFSSSAVLQAISIGIPTIYLLLSLKFWFSKPAIGCSLSLACFLLATALNYF